MEFNCDYDKIYDFTNACTDLASSGAGFCEPAPSNCAVAGFMTLNAGGVVPRSPESSIWLRVSGPLVEEMNYSGIVSYYPDRGIYYILASGLYELSYNFSFDRQVDKIDVMNVGAVLCYPSRDGSGDMPMLASKSNVASRHSPDWGVLRGGCMANLASDTSICLDLSFFAVGSSNLQTLDMRVQNVAVTIKRLASASANINLACPTGTVCATC
ncbi:MAG: hypothetical protein FWG10_09035 [Eubacteriaceae bacterium]|nr:hypothetical protein [Eubacteriaceae bacterium]